MRLGASLLGVTVALGLMVAAVPGVLADTESAETPAGTYYVLVDDRFEDRNLTAICDQLLPGGFTCVPIHASTPEHSDAGVYEETNGCEGLQTASWDCDGDGTVEAADEPVAAYEDGTIRPWPLA